MQKRAADAVRRPPYPDRSDSTESMPEVVLLMRELDNDYTFYGL